MSATTSRESSRPRNQFQVQVNGTSYSDAPGKYFRGKAPAIRLFAAFLLVLAFPILVVLVVLIRVTSRGPAIFRQVRAGKHGKPFLMYKLRTMTVHAESDSGPSWSSHEDPRLTPLGRWMRRHHLDELPQLVNVILGQMDLFGPRPERPEFVRVLSPLVPNYERRMDVLPGITGLAQIALPADTDLVSVQRKLRMDLEYIRRASFSLDLRTFVCTLLRLIGVHVRLAMRISRVSKTVDPMMSELDQSLTGRCIRIPATLHQLKSSGDDSLGQFGRDRVNGKRTPKRTSRVNSENGTSSHLHNANNYTLRETITHDSIAGTELLNALTIDVEDYFQVTGFENSIDRKCWDDYESRVAPNTRRLLRILDRHAVKATFFVLGWVADRFPDIVREIHDHGHEIGSHSYWHRLIYQLTPDEFREDVCRSRDILEDIVDQRVTLFRAPSFSITEESTWALDILIEEGFTIDTSIYPIHHDRYGMPHAPTHVHEIRRDAGSIWEFPPSVLKTCGTNVPVAGGGYFRFYPLELTCYAIQRVNKDGVPFLFYIHPWEIDPQQPQLNAGTRLSRFRHYVHLGAVESRLELLLELFKFGCLSDALVERRSNVSVPQSCNLSENGRSHQLSRPR